MYQKIKEAADFILQRIGDFTPEAGVILGTGLGGLVKEIDIEFSFDYQDLPHFPVSTVETHKGKLLLGTIEGKSVIVMQGRFHHYEGYDLKEVVFPVRVMKLLGIKNLFVSNAAGGINPNFQKGDLMIISDHINQFPGNPLIGKNIDELGGRFPDMSEPYNQKMIAMALDISKQFNLNTKKGVYVGVPGPMLETPAEYKFLRVIGADAVGMSTIPEVIAARHMDIPCFACSIITDICHGEIKPVDISEIIAIAMKAEPKLTTLIKNLIQKV